MSDSNPAAKAAREILSGNVPPLAELQYLATAALAAQGDSGALRRMLYDPALGFECSVDHWAAGLLAGSLAKSLQDMGAENYLEIRMSPSPAEGHEDVGPINVLIQRAAGKTPAQVNVELTARIAELEARG